MNASSVIIIATLIFLCAAFALDTWHAVAKSENGYTDLINNLGFLRSSPWIRTLIKLPLLAWIGITASGLTGVKPIDRTVIICWVYIIIVAFSLHSFYRRKS